MINADRRAKTVMATSTHVEVGVLDQRVLLRHHAIEARGTVLFSLDDVPPRCAQRITPDTRGPLLDLLAVDVTSVLRPDRVRGMVRMTGTLEIYPGPVRENLAEHLGVDPDAQVARLVPEHVSLEWRVETPAGRPLHTVIDEEDYAAAPVDPLGGWEDGWMAHLDAHHRETLRGVVSRLAPIAPDASVRPILADELGMVVRVTQGATVNDLRVPFPQIVTCGCEAVQALNSLVMA